MDAVVIFLLVLYVPLVIVSIIGNILIMLALSVSEIMRKPFNVFHVNLALGDFLFAIGSIFDAVQFVTGETIYSEFTCILTGYLVEASYTVSVLTLTVMAKDRYEVVDKPLKNKKKHQAKDYHIVSCFVVFPWIILHFDIRLYNADSKCYTEMCKQIQ